MSRVPLPIPILMGLPAVAAVPMVPGVVVASATPSAAPAAAPAPAPTPSGPAQRFTALLDQVPASYRADLTAALNSPAFLLALLDDPSLLEQAGAADRGALGRLRDLLPEGTMRSMLDTYLGAGGAIMGFARLLGIDMQAQAREQLRRLVDIAPVFRDPDVQRIVRLLIAADLPIGTMVDDLANHRLDGAVLDRVVSGQFTPSDAVTLLAYARDLKGGEWTVPPAFLQRAVNLAHLPSSVVSFVDTVRVGRGDSVSIRLREFPRSLAAQLPPEVRNTREFIVTFDELRSGRVQRSISLGFGTTMKLASDALTVHWTGVGFLDDFISLILHLLLGIFTPIVFLLWLIGRPNVRVSLSRSGVEGQPRFFGVNVGTAQRL